MTKQKTAACPECKVDTTIDKGRLVRHGNLDTGECPGTHAVLPYFMVLTSQQYWGTGFTLAEAKRNARYRKADNALVLEWDREPEKWDINGWGQVMWSEDAKLVQEYELHGPSGSRHQIR